MALALSKDSLNSEKAGAWFDRLQSLQITRRLGLTAMISIAVAAGLPGRVRATVAAGQVAFEA